MNPASLVKISRVASGALGLDRRAARRDVPQKSRAQTHAPARLSRARGAVLGGALEYQRAEDGPRLSSMDALLDQEHEHLRTAVARVCALRPRRRARGRHRRAVREGVSPRARREPRAERQTRGDASPRAVHGRRRRAVPGRPRRIQRRRVRRISRRRRATTPRGRPKNPNPAKPKTMMTLWRVSRGGSGVRDNPSRRSPRTTPRGEDGDDANRRRRASSTKSRRVRRRRHRRGRRERRSDGRRERTE